MKNITADDLIRSSLIDKKTSEKIVGDLLKISAVELFLKRKSLILSPALINNYKKIENKIREGVPAQYACGEADFYGLRFYVDKNVLIPRPETEIMVEKGLKKLELRSKSEGVGKRKLKVIDIGTGSGCIIISLIHNLKFSVLPFATDISSDALRIAKRNAKTHKVKINFFKSNLLQNKKLPEKFDLILSNLPYLPSNYPKIYPKNLSDPLCFEPRLALDGGKDGTDLIKKLLSELPDRLFQGGLAILEIDPAQKKFISLFIKKIGLKARFIKDLNRHVRFALITH